MTFGIISLNIPFPKSWNSPVTFGYIRFLSYRAKSLKLFVWFVYVYWVSSISCFFLTILCAHGFYSKSPFKFVREVFINSAALGSDISPRCKRPIKSSWPWSIKNSRNLETINGPLQSKINMRCICHKCLLDDDETPLLLLLFTCRDASGIRTFRGIFHTACHTTHPIIVRPFSFPIPLI